MTALLAALLVAAVVTTGLAVGLLWAWAVAVLPALRTAGDTLFVEFTQRVNVAILNPRFLLCFVGALVLDLAATVLAALDGRGAVLLPAALALAGYAATVGITRAVNIPLNNRMDAAREPGPARAMFETRWTRWNAVRTLTGVLSLACLGWALAAL
ncbi:anthrone oxygenase family protein [Jidongwangia harbinensis]|uniref:anthrone oxygenase family protein n=1 Tax=Jidongwangia harbinensis TaxID=2878561 RepID=UPI001CD98D76|nr:anthrone oxygenase family protein [Jidongwangia harbinensis]MCA2214005.1 DUF1772 domain-containing protein [Jidongwangia harbinensis]